MGVPFHEVREWSAAEIDLLAGYYKMAPWGDHHANIQRAMHMQMTANVNRDRDEHPEPYVLNDFMPFHKELIPDDSVEPAGLKSMFKSFARKGKK